MDLRPVQIGGTLDKFPGRTFNTLITAVQQLQAGGDRPPQPLPAAVDGSCVTARFYNTLSERLPLHAIVKLGDPVSKPDAEHPARASRRPLFEGHTPSADEDFIIVPRGARKNGVAIGISIGFAWCKVKFTGASHERAKAIEGDTEQLASGGSGPAEILWHEELPEGVSVEEPATVFALVYLGGGGGSSSNVNAFAIVIEEADADLGSPGRCVLLDNDFEPVDENGDPFEFDVTDPEDGGYDEEAIDAVSVTFYSAHQYAPCPVGVRVWLSGSEIVPGAADDIEHKIKGQMTDPADYYQTFSGAGANKALTGASSAAGHSWTGEECPEPEEEEE